MPAAVIRKQLGISEFAPETVEVELKCKTPTDNIGE
jgi:hypothetical protein